MTRLASSWKVPSPQTEQNAHVAGVPVGCDEVHPAVGVEVADREGAGVGPVGELLSRLKRAAGVAQEHADLIAVGLATARSSRASLLKSAAATAWGAEPAG